MRRGGRSARPGSGGLTDGHALLVLVFSFLVLVAFLVIGVLYGSDLVRFPHAVLESLRRAF